MTDPDRIPQMVRARLLWPLRLTRLGVAAERAVRLFWRDSKEPALVLMPEGVMLFKAQEVLPWSAVDDFNFSENNQMLTVTMPLEAGVVPPTMGVGRRRGQFVKKKQRLVIMLKGVKTMKNEAFAELMVNYWRAYHARQELARMGVQA